MLYNVHYTNENNQEVIAYSLNSMKWKAAVNFTINAQSTPDEDVLLLFILGYYTMRNVIQEVGATTAALAATSV